MIAIQPKSVTAGVGGTARFTVTAQGEGLSYQWQWRRGASGTWANSSLQGCTTATLRVPATLTRNGQQYRCLVTNANGSALSAATTLTVSELPVITAQPESVSVSAGSTAKFTVTASGSDLSYQWQWSSDGGKTWKNSSSSTAGYNTPILSIAATAARSGYRYRCTVTNINGSVHTDAVTLTVN